MNTITIIVHSSVHREILNKELAAFHCSQKKGAGEIHEAPTFPGLRGIQPTGSLPCRGIDRGAGPRWLLWVWGPRFSGGGPCFPLCQALPTWRQ